MDIDRLNPSSVTYIDWFCDYLLANKPCIFASTITGGWRSSKEWITSGLPNWDFLTASFGGTEVPIVDVEQSIAYDAPIQSRMKLSDFASAQHKDGNSLYLKDWHFVKDFPAYHAYETPIYFKNDWMNEYWDAKGDAVESDYRFVYIGGRFTCWSANICGQKRWILVRPGTESQLDVSCMKAESLSNRAALKNDIRVAVDSNPHLRQSGHILDIIQQPGEIIFVPSNWHHQVHNVGSVISINHNWCNGANINLVRNYLSQRLEAVKKELLDCRPLTGTRDWFEQCQLVLKCDTGLNFQELVSMLDVIARNRLHRLSKSGKIAVSQSLFSCELCKCGLAACRRTMNCLEQLKSRLNAHCSCSSLASPCDFCCAFFDIFDAMAVADCMTKVLCTEDAEVLADSFAGWRQRLAEIVSSLDGLFG